MWILYKNEVEHFVLFSTLLSFSLVVKIFFYLIEILGFKFDLLILRIFR